MVEDAASKSGARALLGGMILMALVAWGRLSVEQSMPSSDPVERGDARAFPEQEHDLPPTLLACAGCHDGTVAPGIVVLERRTRRARRTGDAGWSSLHMVLDGPHPIDARYPDGERGFRRIEDLDARVVLVDGRITCRSCHPGERKVALRANGESVMPCLVCHAR